MKERFTSSLVILGLILLFAVPAMAGGGKIYVENHSFELPGTVKYKNFEEVPGWTTDTPCTDSGVEQDLNAPATDGGWTAFQRSSDPAMWQLTGHTLEAGEVLYLMVDAKITWAANKWAIVLYYDDAGTRVVAAADTVDITDDWTKYTLKLVADEVPAAIGKLVGILFDNVSEGDNWIGLDNVRLSSGNNIVAIDAEKDLFYEELTNPDDGFVYIPYVMYNEDGPPPSGDADLSAHLWMAWDETYLYYYEEVKDDIVHLNNPTNFRNDITEVFIDPDPTQAAAHGCFAFGITAMDSSQADPAALSGVRGLDIAGATPEDFARKVTKDGYVIECRIKWESMVTGTRGPVVPAVGTTFGMALTTQDNDSDDRDGAINWAAVVADAIWNDPPLHGHVELLDGNKVKLVAQSLITGEVNPHAEWYIPGADIFSVTIDAEKDPFYYSLKNPDDGYLQIRWFAHNNNGKPDNDADLSAKLWTAWDETYLYLYEEVKDNVVHVNNATSWQNDVLEVYIDPDPNAAITTAQLGFQMTALDSADADPAALAGVTNVLGYNLSTGATKEDYARRKTSDGYVLECRVKWEVLKDATRGPIVPAAGNIFGMATMNHDNDVSQREGSIAWSAVLNDNVWNTPANHGTVTFLEENKLKFEATSTRSGVVNPLPYDGSLPAIVIDGEKDPFYELLTGPDDGHVYIPARAFNTNGAPKNDKDLSALMWLAWDDTYLYFYEEVADNVVHCNNATNWQNDVLEVYFDPDPTQAATSGCFGFGITAMDSSEADPAGLAGVRGLDVAGSTAEDFSRHLTDIGYVIECRIKWDWIVNGTRGPIAPAVGTTFGMSTMNHDNDVAQREGSISWSAVMNDNVWNVPASLGAVELLADQKVKLMAKNLITGLPNDSADVWYKVPEGLILDVEQISNAKPLEFELSQNYPNPFNPVTTISFAIPKDTDVSLKVYDILGREVVTLVNGVKRAGVHQVKFDGKDFASGMYFYRLQAGSQIKTQKMMMLK